MKQATKPATKTQPRYPGIRAALDGNSAVVACEREASDAAGAYPITPSTQMGEGWAEAAASGHLNISDRPLIFIEPEGEHAAAAVTAGLAMTGLRSANFSSGQGIAYMHESLYAAVGKRLTYVLNVGARAMTKATLNVHAGHDDYHCVDDTGFFQMFAKNAQHAADLNIIAHRIAETALNPGIVAQDGFLTTHLIESLLLPERELIAEYLGRPDDIIDTPTPAQRLIYGDKRRRIPQLWDVDSPVMAGIVQNQDSYMQSVAAQRPFFFDHVREVADQAFAAFEQLTGRQYARVQTYRAGDADYLILGQGSVVASAEAVADYLRTTRKLKVGVVNLLMFRPFPGDLLSEIIKGKKGVVVLERLDQPLAEDLPLMREIRAVVSKCMENGLDATKHHPAYTRYEKLADVPRLYSASFGLGSRDLQPEGIIGAVENMLPDGPMRKHFYLGIDFIHEPPLTPKQAVYQQELLAAYPHLKALAVHGSENPNLMPQNSITVRFHSVGGWGAITTGKNLAMTLFDLLGYHIKANPKYGSEKKGQPTTYYLSAAPEPIRVNCEYFYVDVVLSPDPNVFNHTNAVAGLRPGGVFIIQSDQPSAAAVWARIPARYQKIIADNKIRVFFLDAFKIARDEATDPDLQLRMQGIAFQGAFFAASGVVARAGLTEERLLDAIKTQLQHKFGGKGARVVEDNLRVVKRGFDEVQEIADQPIGKESGGPLAIPVMVKRQPQSHEAIGDIQRFWEQTGSFYARGLGNENLADPFIALGTMPAASALFRDMTGIRFEHPQWIPENCTGCGECYTVCPDTAIPGLVSDVAAVLETVLRRVKKHGHEVEHLPKAIRVMERHLRTLLAAAGEKANVREVMQGAVERTIAELGQDKTVKDKLTQEFAWFNDELATFQFALTRPYFTLPEKQAAGSGGLLSITVDPYTCKGCGECIAVCPDDALRPLTQTPDSVAQLRTNWDFWLDLPTTPQKYIRIDGLEECIGVLHSLLLDKHAYGAFTSGDGACLGCSEKTVLHLFTATVEALLRPRVAKHVEYLSELIRRLEADMQRKLVAEVNVDDVAILDDVLHSVGNEDVTLSGIAKRIETLRGVQPVDKDWLARMIDLIKQLKDLRWRYSDGPSNRGRSAMGMINATGCTSVWGSTYPFNPYPFPWANHLFQDSPSMAMGVFEGHMAKMAEGFKAIRRAELELSRSYDPKVHDDFLRYFSWQHFSDEEFKLCPPVVVVGGDGAMYDIGFQNLSRAMMSGKPLKMVVVDTQVYSNTGGQACTSGFKGQVSDMAAFGKVTMGKQEVRKEIGLIAMAHRTSYVMQSTIAHPNHMIEGFIEGLLSKRPALFNCYTSCQPEHGIGDDMGHHQAKLAVESRAYPLLRYNPDKGNTVAECLDLSGNPGMDDVWPTYTLNYRDAGQNKTMPLPLTFADFAMTEGRFRKHFRSAPPDTWHDNMVPLADYLTLAEGEREGKFPYIWTIDSKQRLSRLLVSETMVESCRDRADFWAMLKGLAGGGQAPVDSAALETKVRDELMQKFTSAVMHTLAEPPPQQAHAAQAQAAPTAKSAAPAAQPAAEYMAPWLDTEQCSSCDECIKLNPKIFAYNENKKAYIKDPSGGPYSDLVKAAERCTAQVIHPGLPRDRSAKDIEKWIKRAEKFN